MNDYYDGSDYDFEMPTTDEEEGVTPVTPMERIKSYDATSQTKPSVSGFDKLCMAKKRCDKQSGFFLDVFAKTQGKKLKIFLKL